MCNLLINLLATNSHKLERPSNSMCKAIISIQFPNSHNFTGLHSRMVMFFKKKDAENDYFPISG